MLIYHIGKPTTPEIGCIFAYNDYLYAELFITQHMMTHCEIWLADAVVYSWSPTWIVPMSKITAFWRGDIRIGKNEDYLSSPPPGTIWCSELTITKRLAYATNPLPGIVDVKRID